MTSPLVTLRQGQSLLFEEEDEEDRSSKSDPPAAATSSYSPDGGEEEKKDNIEDITITTNNGGDNGEGDGVFYYEIPTSSSKKKNNSNASSTANDLAQVYGDNLGRLQSPEAVSKSAVAAGHDKAVGANNNNSTRTFVDASMAFFTPPQAGDNSTDDQQLNGSYWAMMGESYEYTNRYDNNIHDDDDNGRRRDNGSRHSTPNAESSSASPPAVATPATAGRGRGASSSSSTNHNNNNPLGYLRGIDMSEEISMTLLETSLISNNSSSSSTITSRGEDFEADGDDDDDAALLSQKKSDNDPDTSESHQPVGRNDHAMKAEGRQQAVEDQPGVVGLLRRRISHLESALMPNHRRRTKKKEECDGDRAGGDDAASVEDEYRSAPIAMLTAPESLWERNKMLVKEVRFADQTCVELASQKLALEKEVRQWKDRIEQERMEAEARLEHERKEKAQLFQNLQESNRVAARAEATCENLRSQMKQVEVSCQSLREHTDQQKSEAVQQKERLKSLISRLEDEKELMRNELDEAKAIAAEEKDELERQVLELEKANVDASHPLRAQQDQIEELKNDNMRLEGELQKARNELEALKADQDVSRNEDDENAPTSSRVAELEAENSHLQVSVKDMNQLQKELDQARQQLGSQAEELEDLRRASNQALARCTELQVEQDSLDGKSMGDDLVVNGDSGPKPPGTAAAEDSNQDSTELEDTRAQLITAKAELEQARAVIAETTDMSQQMVADLTSQLVEAVSALQILEEERGRGCLDIAGSVQSAIAKMESQATALDENHAEVSQQMFLRISSLERALHFIRESVVFDEDEEDDQAESSKEGSDDPDISALTGASQTPAELQVKTEPDEDALIYATLESCTNKSNDLEMMEEARFDFSPGPNGAAVDAVSDGSINGDSMSSIAGLSHLFSEGLAVDLSVSVSRSPEENGTCNTGSMQLQRADAVASRNSELERRVQALIIELDSTKASLVPLANERDSLESQVEALIKEKSLLELFRDAATTNETSLKRELDDLKRQCHEADGKSKALQESVDALQAERKTLRDQADSVTCTSGAVSRRLEVLENQITSYTSINKALEERCGALSEECDCLRSERDFCKLQAANMSTQCASLQNDVKVLLLQKEKAELQLQGMMDSLTQSEELSTYQQSNLLTVLKEKECLQRKIEQLEDKNDSLANKCAELVECQSKLASMASANTQQMRDIEEYKNLLKATEDLEVCTEERLLESQTELEQLRAERGTYEERCLEIEKKLNQSKEDQRVLAVRLRNVVNAIEVSAGLKEAGTVASQSRDDAPSFQAQLERLRSIDALVELTVSERDDAASQLARCEDEAQDLRTRLRQASEKSTSVESELAGVKAALCRKDEEVGELRKQVDTRDDKLRRLREYCRKLTDKCNEWEKFSAVQTAATEKLKAANQQKKDQIVELLQYFQQRDQVRFDSATNNMVCKFTELVTNKRASPLLFISSHRCTLRNEPCGRRNDRIFT